MSKKECADTVAAIKLFVEDYEITERRNPQKCKRFFEIVKHIKFMLQVTTALLERIEALENEMESINKQIKEK